MHIWDFSVYRVLALIFFFFLLLLFTHFLHVYNFLNILFMSIFCDLEKWMEEEISGSTEQTPTGESRGETQIILYCYRYRYWLYCTSLLINTLEYSHQVCDLYVCVTAEEWECQACEGLVCGEELWLQSAETSAAGCLSLFSAEPEAQTLEISGGEG